MVDLTSVWPTWGKTGSQPSDSSDYSPGDNPKAESFNHLWHHIQDTFSTVETWINDRETDLSIDSNGNVTVENGNLNLSDNSLIIPESGSSENYYISETFNNLAIGSSDKAVSFVEFNGGAKSINFYDTDIDFGGNPLNNADSLDVNNTISASTVNTADTQTKTISSGEHHYAADYSGSDADARLDNALSAANNAEVIHLEDQTYTTDRTISTNYTIYGTHPTTGSIIDGNWTFDANVELKNSRIDGSLTINDPDHRLENCHETGSGVTVSADRVLVTGMTNINLTFESGTSGGLIDACVDGNVTDNGNNTVGDIS